MRVQWYLMIGEIHRAEKISLNICRTPVTVVDDDEDDILLLLIAEGSSHHP